MIKKIISIFFIFIISVNSFAAIVSDNDGSAFVTKAEFEALKNSFSKQLDDYNASIDGKIDGAIASYLAGIKLSEAPINYWDKVLYASNNKIRFTNMTVDSGTAAGSLTTDVVVNTNRVHRRLETKYYTDLRSHENRGTDDKGKAGIIYQVGQTQAIASGVDLGLLCRSYFRGGGTYLSSQTSWTDQIWVKYSSLASNNVSNTFTASTQVSTGSGKLWELNRLPNDKFEIKKWNSKAYLSTQVDVTAYTYKDYYTNVKNSSTTSSSYGWLLFQNLYTKAGGVDDYTGSATGIAIDIAKGTKFTVTDVGSKPADGYNATSNWNFGQQKIGWAKEDDGVDYSFYLWGKNSTQTINCITDAVVPEWSSATKETGSSTSSTYHTYLRPYCPYTGPAEEDVKVRRINYSYYLPAISPAQYKLNQLQNQYAGAPVTDDVMNGQGAPLFCTSSEETNPRISNMHIKLFKNDNTTLTDGTVKVMISLNKFKDGDFATADDKVYEADITVPTVGVVDISIPQFSVKEKDHVIWVNLYETGTEGKLVYLESVTV